MKQPIDLRSDTVTKPTPAMRRAMAQAEVGDDVIDIDPTVERLQQRIAEMLGKEAALFMPSGTMTNQVAIRVHCQPGDELICEAESHIYNYEQGAFAQLSGVVARTVLGQAGLLRVEQLQGLVRPPNEHMVRTRLVCLENTHNRGAGCVLPHDDVAKIGDWAAEQGLRRHLDGARLFNAVVASGITADQWSAHFDTVSVCFSKGLGAPVGSALAGPRELIQMARRQRKVFGGGMRQSGIIAAGALHALDHNIPRLAEDHATAQILAEAVREIPGLEMDPPGVETNMLIFRVDEALGDAAELTATLHAAGVWVLPFGPQHIRAVTHLDVTEEDVRTAAGILRKTLTD